MSFQPHTATEIASQPVCWRRAHQIAREVSIRLPLPGERVAVVGCGTSYFMALAYALLRESGGHGLTDAFPASEFPATRDYDRMIAISRSGTTTEILDLLDQVRGSLPILVITADPEAPVADHADETLALDFADEQSVVQTRFATTTLAMLRSSLGHDIGRVADDADQVLARDLDPTLSQVQQFTFLGRSWTTGLAHEAALKIRESAGTWTESYHAMEYRHGPIAVAQPGRVTWMFGAAPTGLAEQVTATGARFINGNGLDPMAELITAQRVALAQAQARDLDPDRPRNLSRAVVLDVH